MKEGGGGHKKPTAFVITQPLLLFNDTLVVKLSQGGAISLISQGPTGVSPTLEVEVTSLDQSPKRASLVVRFKTQVVLRNLKMD